ncbi:hypothetical protein OKA04_06495 [Luteolibacter flavescens]|uniref:Lipocalin-like domain-containing protein n=1 Tax=Luteolibacter flavescens TaxID=1859460 RepID=A0ABT3FMF2_9BACT|nr:hypothetical protein [Luteolibacter flavescens]MCW1884374.1 hypothetical protein [Luteolibacter flavescens]
MDREAFALPDGRLFSAWDLRFGDWQRRRESRPSFVHLPDGSVRSGAVSYTTEWASIRFCVSGGSLETGATGQLSSGDDLFYQVTVVSIEWQEDHLRVTGTAMRNFDFSVPQ